MKIEMKMEATVTTIVSVSCRGRKALQPLTQATALLSSSSHLYKESFLSSTPSRSRREEQDE
jgi:hypothetical protein